MSNPRPALLRGFFPVALAVFLALGMAPSAPAQELQDDPSTEIDVPPRAAGPGVIELAAVPNALREALMEGRTRDALAILDQLLEDDPDHADGWLYFRARALAEGGRVDEAIGVLEQLEAAHPDGDWLRKARFLRADLLRSLRRYAEAEAIYEEEAARLQSDARQAELAGIYLRFARMLSTPPDPVPPGGANLDYARAATLFQKALELGIPAGLREQALFGVARCREELGDWNAAGAAWKEYLADFGEAVDLAGVHPLEARYRLARSMQQRGDQVQARYTFEDLVSLLEDAREDTGSRFARALHDVLASFDQEQRDEVADLEGRARFAIARTYGDGAQQLALAVAAYQRLVDAQPEHRLVGRARYEIAQAWRSAGRLERSLDALRDFLQWQPAGELAQETREQNARLRQRALFDQGQVLMQLDRPSDAIPVFTDYVGRYPTGAEWADAQQARIDAEYRIGAKLREEEQWQEARAAWNRFLTDYPLDARAQQIAYDLGQMHVERAGALDADDEATRAERERLWREAMAAWERVTQKYPNSASASLALYSTGMLLEFDLLELEAAIDAYRRCNFGPHAEKARARLRVMTAESLAVETPRIWRTDETPRVRMQIRNTAEVAVRIYRLDLQAYFRKHLTHQRIEDLDLDLIAADQELAVPVEGYADYKPIEQDIALPLEGAGVWAVAVEDGERRATTLVVRSDVDMVLKSSRREVFVYAQDMRRDRPASGVDVLVAVPDPSGGPATLHKLETGRDGVARLELDELASRPELRVLAHRGEHYASDGLSVQGLALSSGLQPRGYIYPDRSAYRPGQLVHWRAVIREVEEGRFDFEPGTEYRVEVVDAEGRVVHERRQELSEFGTLHGELLLAPQAPLGNWIVRAARADGETFQGGFAVREFQLQTVALDIDFEQPAYYRGEVVHGTVRASYYYGEPLAERRLDLRLPDGRQLQLETNADGEAGFEIETRDLPGSTFLGVFAHLPTEGVSAQAGVPVSALGFAVAVEAAREVVLAGSSFAVSLSTADAAGDPVARALRLEVLRRVADEDGGWQEVEAEAREVRTDERGRASVTLALEEGGSYLLRASGPDRFGNPVVGESTVFVSGEADAQKLRILAERNRLPVGEELQVELVNRTGARLALLTYEGERVLRHRILELEAGANAVTLPMDAELAPNFHLALAVMDGNAFHSAVSEFELERRLRVAIEAQAKQVAPGEEAAVTLTATDENGRPVSAEFSLAVVDESVFAQFADGLPAIDAYFQSGTRRPAGFRTTSSCDFRYEGVTRSIAQALLEEEREQIARVDWEADREALRAELERLSDRSYRGPGDHVPPGAGAPGTPATPSTPSLGLALEPDAEVFARARAGLGEDFASESFNEVLGFGGGAGGKYGGRAGRGAGRPGSDARFRYALDAVTATTDTAAGEMAAWANAGLAFWTPSVVTGLDGRAELRFTMPERSTRWRLTARGAGREDHFGQGATEIVSRAPFFAELRAPAVLTEGDRPEFLARVHNLTGEDVAVDVKLRVRAGEFERTLLPSTLQISVPTPLPLADGAEAELRFELAEGIPLCDDVILELVAEASGAEASHSARARSQVPVRAWGTLRADYASGVLTSEDSFVLQLPPGELRDRTLEINFGSDLGGLVVDAALDRPGLIAVPRHGIRPTQTATASRLIGVCAALEMVERFGGRAGGGTDLRRRGEALAAALAATQREDGGWSWSGSDSAPAEPETSARAMHALAEARRRGIPVAAEVLDRGVGYLLQAFQQTSQNENERKAILVHALALHERADFGAANRLHRMRGQLSPAGQAYTALALIEMGRTPMAAELGAMLAEGFDADRGVPVAANRTWSRSQLEMNALASLVLQRATPQAAATRASVDWLLDHRPWFDSRARGIATAAVALWAGTTQPAVEDSVVTLEIDGERVEMEVGAGQFVGFSDQLDRDRVQVRLSVQGRGRPYFQAVLRGFDRTVAEQRHEDLRITRQWYERDEPIYEGERIQTGFSVVRDPAEVWRNEVAELPRGELTRASVSFYIDVDRSHEIGERRYTMLTVPLPAGTTVVEGTVQGSFERFHQGRDELVFFIGQRVGSGWVHFKLAGSLPGAFRVLPARIEDIADPSAFAVGAPTSLTVLPRGLASSDEYRPTPDELYHLGLARLRHGDEQGAYDTLSTLYERFGDALRDRPLAEAAGKLLFLAIDRGRASEIVRYFEVLKEKDPGLNIPFDKVLAVGRAYREIEEYERALLIFRATIEESFGKDLKVAGTLESEDEPAGSLAVLERLWMEYPDLPVVVDTYLALSDQLLALAPRAHRVPGLVASGLGRSELTLAGITLLNRFLALYHDRPLAAEAGLNLVAAYLELEDFATTDTLAAELAGEFEDPRFVDALRYSRAVALWYLGEEGDAVRILQAIAAATYPTGDGGTRPSENRDLALYILAQIHHARREYGEAAAYYERVDEVFADAREVLESFREERIVVDEVTEVRPGRDAKLELRYRNVDEVELLVYRVDLMTLYLREKNLSQITAVNLAGIDPTLRRSVSLRSSQGMREEKKKVDLSLDDPGAYLVICRAGALHTSGLVLVSDIELEVEEDAAIGRLRIQVVERGEEAFMRDVDVRVVGNQGGDFVRGRTDPRGLFVAEGVQGSATVIARHDGDHYAFHRGAPPAPPVPEEARRGQPHPQQEGVQQLEAQDYLDNVMRLNTGNVQQRQLRLQEQIQRARKGVSVGQTSER